MLQCHDVTVATIAMLLDIAQPVATFTIIEENVWNIVYPPTIQRKMEGIGELGVRAFGAIYEI